LLAEQIARKAHSNQFRRDGVTPYITHPEAVANKLKSEGDEAVAVAWLHDVLEDTKMTPECLRDAGIPMTVIDAVCDLTHQREEPYADYLEWIKRNPLAVKVKVADMLHNLSDAPTQKQIVKYARGLLALLG
jgi:(p)ppGpp synthase/HD superfamily hydrolase